MWGKKHVMLSILIINCIFHYYEASFIIIGIKQTIKGNRGGFFFWLLFYCYITWLVNLITKGLFSFILGKEIEIAGQGYLWRFFKCPYHLIYNRTKYIHMCLDKHTYSYIVKTDYYTAFLGWFAFRYEL